jgi:hypothetical protein
MMQGYVAEKPFDCAYASVIPSCLGAKEIAQFCPHGVSRYRKNLERHQIDW